MDYRAEYEKWTTDSYFDEATQEELKAIESTERLVSGLIDCGWGYDQIKDFIQQTHTKMIAN